MLPPEVFASTFFTDSFVNDLVRYKVCCAFVINTTLNIAMIAMIFFMIFYFYYLETLFLLLLDSGVFNYQLFIFNSTFLLSFLIFWVTSISSFLNIVASHSCTATILSSVF